MSMDDGQISMQPAEKRLRFGRCVPERVNRAFVTPISRRGPTSLCQESDLVNHNNRNTKRNFECSEDRQGIRFHLETGVVTVAAISAKNIDLVFGFDR